MKKIIFLGMLSLTLSPDCKGQFLGGFFSQKKADLQALEKQLAAIAVYIKQTETGYEKARMALGMIGQLKKGELDLHSAYFGSLRSVNPMVTGDEKVSAIVQYQSAILQRFRDLITQANASKEVNTEESKYLQSLYEQQLQDGNKNLDALAQVTTPGACSMSDAERLHCIDQLYMEMKNRYAFSRSIAGDFGWVTSQRAAERNDIGAIQKMETK